MTKPIAFEQSMAELQALVQQLEKGDCPLEDALKYFEKGISTAKQCQNMLTQAEQTIERLSSENSHD